MNKFIVLLLCQFYLHVIKNDRFTKYLNKYYKSHAGKLHNTTGKQFEEFFAGMIRHIKKQVNTRGKYSVDFETKDWIFELKASMRIDTKQLDAIAEYAYSREVRKKFAYVFLNKPPQAGRYW